MWQVTRSSEMTCSGALYRSFNQRRIREFGVKDGKRFAQAYNVGLGAESPAGSRGRKGLCFPPEAERYSLFRSTPNGGRNLVNWPVFLGSFEIGPTEQVFLLHSKLRYS